MTLSFNTKVLERITFPYVFYDDLFTQQELQDINTYCSKYGAEESTIASPSGSEIDENIRKSHTKFHHPTDENTWIFKKLLDLSEQINNEWYGFDLIGFDSFQYTEYNGAGANYSYHMDMFLGESIPDNEYSQRKLSFSLILSDPNDYTGGKFEFLTSEKNPLIAEQPKGRLIAFPSFLLHKVHPIQTGTRKSLVFWVKGPKFK